VRDIFKGKVYPFLHLDQSESAPQMEAGSIPTFFLIPSPPPQNLSIWADIITKRKSRPQDSLSWWPGLGHFEDVEQVLEKIFAKLTDKGIIYLRNNIWYLKTGDQLPVIAHRLKTKQFMITPEGRLKKYVNFFESRHQWAISSHTKSRFTSWFIKSALIVEELDKFRSALPLHTLLAPEGKNMKAITGALVIGLQLFGDLPFRELLVLDNEESLSNSDSNDAVRFSITSRLGRYRSAALPPELAEKRFVPFANKVWNASRFVAMHTERGEEETVRFHRGSAIDRWFAHLLASKIDEINDLLEQCRVNEALALTHRTFQQEFCNWYLELVRPDLDKASTRAMLRFALLELLKLLFPFLPALSKNIHTILFQEATPLASQNFPTFDSNMIFPRQFAQVELLKKLIQHTRKTKEETGITWETVFFVTLYSKSKKERKMIAGLLPYFNTLTGSEETTLNDILPPETSTIQGEYLNWRIIFTLKSDEARLLVFDRLKKEREAVSQKIEQLETTTPSNKSKQHLQELFKRKENLDRRINDLS
jgi:valyl-tRNA synthetase